MSELTARLAIYGAIDRAALEDPDLVDDVAGHLPTYRPDGDEIPSALGWYDQMSELIAAAPDSNGLDEPDVGRAIDELAELPVEHPIEIEHRLHALFLATQLLQGIDTGPDGALVQAMSQVVRYRRDPDAQIGDPIEAASALVAMMTGGGATGARADDDRTAMSYATLSAAARRQHLVDPLIAELAELGCNEATAWFDSSGRSGIAAVVTSRVSLTVSDREVGALRLAFHPGRWPTCLPGFWGSMTALAPPEDLPTPTTDPGSSLFVYREHVGDQVAGSQWFSPVLEFWFDELTVGPPGSAQVDGFALHYGLARELPAGEAQDPHLLVDDGEMAVRRRPLPDGSMNVHAVMYKQLAMVPPLPSAGLAIFACASGWADHAKAMVWGCLLDPTCDGDPSWPGHA